MAQLNCAVLALDPDLRGQLSQLLENTGHASVAVAVERCSDLEDVVWRVGPDLLLVALDEEPEAVLAAVELLGDRRPVVLMCGPQDESDLILRSMRIGVRDYLPLPVPSEELTAVVQSLILERTASGALAGKEADAFSTPTESHLNPKLSLAVRSTQAFRQNIVVEFDVGKRRRRRAKMHAGTAFFRFSYDA